MGVSNGGAGGAGLECQTNLLYLRVSDPAVTCILGEKAPEYTISDDKIKIFWGWSLAPLHTLTPLAPYTLSLIHI